MSVVEAAGTTCLNFLDQLRDHSQDMDWGEFDDRYRGLLYRHACRCGASSAEAEDVVQDIELSLFKTLKSFTYDPQKGGFRAYLYTAVAHAVRRRAARRARTPAILDPERVADMPDNRSAQGADEREAKLRRLRETLCAIAPEFEPATLEAFRLHVLADWPVEETATHLGVSRASVYQAKSRVLKRIRERLAQSPSGAA